MRSSRVYSTKERGTSISLLRSSCGACYRTLDPSDWSGTVAISGGYYCRECVTPGPDVEGHLLHLWMDWWERKGKLERLEAVRFAPEFVETIIHTEPGTAPMVNLRVMAAAQNGE